ncbi:MAG: glycosyltransferase [Hyphomonadaceae bacterium]|nr:glycosyltransferase [Hyphomonadaceae bacterium]
MSAALPPTPKVSAIVASYNRAESLFAALDSVFAQTLAPFEVFVVDDCSPKFDIFELMRPLEGRVRVLRNEKNSAVGHSRNHAVRHASGDYVAFLDDDDTWKPHKLERQIAAMGDAQFSVCGLERIPDGTNKVWDIDYIHPHMLKQGNPFCPPSGFICRRSMFEVMQFDEDLRYGEDWDFLIRASLLGPIRYVAEPLFNYQMPSQTGVSMVNEVKQLRPEQLQVRYDATDKHRAFLGEHYYNLRIATSTLSFLKSRNDPMRFVMHSINKAGLWPTLQALGNGAIRQVQQKLGGNPRM